MKTKYVILIGECCPYCGNVTEAMCCGEVHHEPMYETQDGQLLTYSELTINHLVVDSFDDIDDADFE